MKGSKWLGLGIGLAGLLATALGNWYQDLKIKEEISSKVKEALEEKKSES